VFEGISFVDLTAPSLLGITVLLFLLGRIIPRQTLLDQKKETDTWREAYFVERDARAAADAQTKELLELSKTTNEIVVGVLGHEYSHHKAGGSHVASTSPQK
jgi:hypothetical protein